MKVEKVNENKIKITLTLEELKDRKITLNDIENDMDKARNLFLDLLSESDINEDFVIEDSHLYIEASADNNNVFVVTITRIDNIPELSKYSNIGKPLKKKRKTKLIADSKSKPNYRVSSSIFSFSSLDEILEMTDVMKSQNIYLGKNSLYKGDNVFYILFSPSSVKNKNFIKTFGYISEYCQNYYSTDIFQTSIKERCSLVIENNALQKLLKI